MSVLPQEQRSKLKHLQPLEPLVSLLTQEFSKHLDSIASAGFKDRPTQERTLLHLAWLWGHGPDWGGKRMKNTNKSRSRKAKVGWSELSVEETSAHNGNMFLLYKQERQGECIWLNKEVGLVGADKQRRQGVWYTAGSSRQVYLILVGMVFIGEQSSDYKYPGRESYSGHFLCTLSISTFGPEEGFAIFL